MMPKNTISRTSPPDLTSAGQRCLLLGAKGSGMTALAEILLDLGHLVTGLDHNFASRPSGVPAAGARLRLLPWQNAAIDARHVDLCVASPAVAKHSLVNELRIAGTPILSLHECVAQIFSDSQQICVAGTHGKSTTSAMLAWILDCAGRHPGFFVGAQQPAFGCSGRALTNPRVHSNGAGAEDWCVLESCEFSRSFYHLRPRIVALTGIERDHFDCFPDQASEDAAFEQFVGQLPVDGTVVWNVRCDRSRRIVLGADRSQVSFFVSDEDCPALSEPSSWVADRLQTRPSATTFRLRPPMNGPDASGATYPVSLQVPGRHNVSNAVAAIAAACVAGVDVGASCRALARFSGIGRRFEVRGHYNGITLIDDYAHHPTAIQTTLRTVRAVYPGCRIIVAFEPHQLVRTEALFSEFVHSLQLADEVLLLPVLPARENVTHRLCCRTSGRLVKELNRRGTKAFLFANLDQIVSRIDHSGRPRDIFLTMGAGRTNAIHDQFIERLRRNSVA